MARRVALKIGYQGHFTTVTRSIPEDEPLPWDADTQLRVVGQPVPRIDARQKVTGQATKTRELRLPDMLYGVNIRSPYAAARTRRVTRRGQCGFGSSPARLWSAWTRPCGPTPRW